MILTRKVVDLHIHTNFSDGTFSPCEVVTNAADKGLSAIAITDHDCVEGILPAIEASASKEIEVIPGVELTAEVNKIEIHILGLFIKWNTPWFMEKLKQMAETRVIRMRKMVEKLKTLGVKISEEEVFALSRSGGSIGRLHLARALLNKKAVGSLKEAFELYIGERKPCYVERLRISPEEAIQMIKKLKGISILAHPGTMFHDELIPVLAEAGLMGIEVYHFEHSARIMKFYHRLAEKHKLLISGGSDCHGMGKGFPFIGLVKVPYEVLEKLKQAKERIF